MWFVQRVGLSINYTYSCFATPTGVHGYEVSVKKKAHAKAMTMKRQCPELRGKLKQRPLNINFLTFGREIRMHRSSTTSDRGVLLQASKELQRKGQITSVSLAISWSDVLQNSDRVQAYQITAWHLRISLHPPYSLSSGFAGRDHALNVHI